MITLMPSSLKKMVDVCTSGDLWPSSALPSELGGDLSCRGGIPGVLLIFRRVINSDYGWS
jgi:hypothetical protein